MKKEKNAAKAEDELLNQTEEAKKDYQKEEDEDVKEKGKLKKAVIISALLILVFFVILLIWYVKDNSVKEIKYDVNGQQGTVAVNKAEEAEDGEEITVDGCLLDLSGPTVDVTVPLEFYKDGEPENALTKEQSESGYTAVRKENGNIIYTIKTTFFPSVVENLYEYNEKLFNEKYENKGDVLLVSMTRSSQLFTITVQKQGYNADSHKAMLDDLYYKSAIYQCYLGIAPADISVGYQFKFVGEQFPFATCNYKDTVGKSLSAILNAASAQGLTAQAKENKEAN